MPLFSLVSQEGPSHAPKFTVQVVVDKNKLGEGTAGAKKDAEQIAAKMAYEKLVNAEDQSKSFPPSFRSRLEEIRSISISL